MLASLFYMMSWSLVSEVEDTFDNTNAAPSARTKSLSILSNAVFPDAGDKQVSFCCTYGDILCDCEDKRQELFRSV